MKKKDKKTEEQAEDTVKELRYEDTLSPEERKQYLKALRRRKQEDFFERNWLVVILSIAVFVMLLVLMLIFMFK